MIPVPPSLVDDLKPVEPARTTGNMAARIVRHGTDGERTLALPSHLTYEKVVLWVQPYLGADERIAEIVEYR